MSISTTKGFSCAGLQAEASRYFQSRAIKCYLGTGAESSVRVCKQSMRTCKLCKCLSTCLLDFWESTGKLCAKQPVTHPIFCHNPSSQSSWFFYACHTPDFLSYFCHRYIHQEGNNWRPSHAFFTYGLTRIWSQDFREEIKHTKPSKMQALFRWAWVFQLYHCLSLLDI